MLGSNWYDRIGYIIHRGKTTWKDVKEDFLAPFKEGLEKYKDYPDFKKYEDAFLGGPVKSMSDLIDHWEEKGYIPVCIKDY